MGHDSTAEQARRAQAPTAGDQLLAFTRPPAGENARPHFAKHSSRRFSWAWLLAGWGVSIASGWALLDAYALSPGAVGRSPAEWPSQSAIALDGRRPTLVMFLHPLCPCSSASVLELSTLLNKCGPRLAAHVVTLRTPLVETERSGGICDAVATLPAVTFWSDDGGTLARRFGVLTSGHVLLYDTRGELIYSGGITSGRGHVGDSPGQRAILAASMGNSGIRDRAPVFGCPLFGSGQAE